MLLLILLVALTARIGVATIVEQHVRAAGRSFLIEGDANGYWELAQRIATGRDYCVHQPPRYVHRTPGFPLLLAGTIRLFGDSVFAATLVLSVVGTVCVGLTWVLGCIAADQRTAAVAAGLTAISPLLVGNSVLVLSETWFAFWMLVCLILLTALLPGFHRNPHTPSCSSCEDGQSGVSGNRSFEVFRQALICGIATGLAVLVRPGWILWAIVSSLIVMCFACGSKWRRGLMGLLICTGCLLALTPWAYRNSLVAGRWVFTSLWSGPSLYDGLHPEADGSSDMRFVDEEPIYATMSEFEANQHYKQRAVEFVLQNPWRTAELAVLKARRYLSLTPNASGFAGGPLALLCGSFYLVFFILVLAGIWNLRQRPVVVVLLLAPFLQFLLVHMVFVGSVRYRLPTEFSLSVLAAAGTTGWAGKAGWAKRISRC